MSHHIHLLTHVGSFIVVIWNWKHSACNELTIRSCRATKRRSLKEDSWFSFCTVEDLGWRRAWSQGQPIFDFSTYLLNGPDCSPATITFAWEIENLRCNVCVILGPVEMFIGGRLRSWRFFSAMCRKWAEDSYGFCWNVNKIRSLLLWTRVQFSAKPTTLPQNTLVI